MGNGKFNANTPNLKETEMEERFRGTTKECLRHYAATLSLTNARGGRKALQPFQEFTHAHPETVYGWLKGYSPPKGACLVRIRYFLELNGYYVAELENLSETVRDFGRLIAYNFFTFEDAVKECDFKNVDYLLRQLVGYRKPRKDQEEKMKEIVDEYEDLMEKKQEELKNLRFFQTDLLPAKIEIKQEKLSEEPEKKKKREKNKKEKPYSEIISNKKTPLLIEFEKPLTVLFEEIEEKIEKEKSAKLKAETVMPEINFVVEKKLLIENLAGLINLARPIAKLVLSDKFSSDERRELRRLTNDSGVFELTNDLKKLCSEKSREIISASENNETKNH